MRGVNENLALAIEQRLGKISQAWKFGLGTSHYHICEFENQIFHNIRFHGTIGFSEQSLLTKDGKKETYQEFVVGVDKNDDSKWIPAVLEQICSSLTQQNSPVLRGDILGPHGPLHSSTTLTAFYATYPFFLDEHLHVLNVNLKQRILVWLIPIYDTEVRFIEKNGWQTFEDILEQNIGSLTQMDRHALA